MIYPKIYRVINVKSPTDAYRLTIVRVLKMLASCLQWTKRNQLIGIANW